MTLFNAQKEKREEGFIKDFLQIRNLGSPGKKVILLYFIFLSSQNLKCVTVTTMIRLDTHSWLVWVRLIVQTLCLRWPGKSSEHQNWNLIPASVFE